MPKIVSLIALPLALAAQLIIASAGFRVLSAIALEGGSALIDPLAFLFLIVGIALLGAAVATVGISSLGILMVAGVNVAVGLVAAGLPLLLSPLYDIEPDLASGLDVAFGSGGTVTLGVSLAAGAIAARGSTPGVSARLAIISAVIGVTFGIAGVAIGAIAIDAVNQGDEIPPELAPFSIALLVVSAVLQGIAAATARWSSVGVGTLGAVLLGAGMLLLIAPSAISQVDLPPGLGLGLSLQAWTGTMASTGAVFVALAIATRWRRGRRSA